MENGTGLGLAIVYQYVVENRGDINVESKIGEGTTMHVSFPGE
ncbi:ATP-binding protein [Desulfitispora alkaliphila]